MKNQIELDHVWKRYQLRRKKGRVRIFFHDWLSAKRKGWPATEVDRDFWAVKDITLNISKGDALGIIGDNGAGKSTFLKLIAGVTYPTRGLVRVRGRVGALVDIGAGMHPELTGYENVYLCGAILGLSRREIRTRFNDIVDFSELSEFLDVPLKRYSSGMKIRLGFAVAAFLDPDVLLIDEILAVGDIAFQRKCTEHIQNLQRGGKTIVFVSHDLDSVQRICDRVLWIKEGQFQGIGAADQIVREYRSFVAQRSIAGSHRPLTGNGAVEVDRVVLTDLAGVPRGEFGLGEDILVDVHYRTSRISPAQIEFSLKVVDSGRRTLILASSGAKVLPPSRAEGIVRCRFKDLPLAPGTYQIWSQVVRLPDRGEEIPWQPSATFAVPETEGQDLHHSIVLHPNDRPILNIPAHWSLDGAPQHAETAAQWASEPKSIPEK